MLFFRRAHSHDCPLLDLNQQQADPKTIVLTNVPTGTTGWSNAISICKPFYKKTHVDNDSHKKLIQHSFVILQRKCLNPVHQTKTAQILKIRIKIVPRQLLTILFKQTKHNKNKIAHMKRLTHLSEAYSVLKTQPVTADSSRPQTVNRRPFNNKPCNGKQQAVKQ